MIAAAASLHGHPSDLQQQSQGHEVLLPYLISFAREHEITQIMIESIQRSWWHIADGGPVVRRIVHEADALGIDVHLIARHEQLPAQALEPSAAKES